MKMYSMLLKDWRKNKIFKEIKLEELQVNPLTLFGKDWCLVTVGNQELGYNGMGSHSGKNEDKIAKARLTPLFIDGTTAYQEADLIFVCKKVYQDDLNEEAFINKAIVEENYPKRDFHTMYVGEIVKIYVKE